jgi:hypothetical protein
LDPVIDSFLSRISELRIQYIEHVANGSLSDYASYQKACGTIEGLSMAEREMKDIASSLSDDAGFNE